MIRAIATALLLVLAACKANPVPQDTAPVRPALWEVSGPLGERAWLFGTIHALPQRVAWRSAAIDKALRGADTLVLEIAAIDDQPALEAEFARRASSPGLPALLDRFPPADSARYAALLRRHSVDPAKFDRYETWAAALALAQALKGESRAEFGIDRDLLRAGHGKRIAELEGASAQLAVFDTLPEADQRDLLAATLAEAMGPEDQEDLLAAAWRSGDMERIAAETQTGLLADPELRAALLTTRNAAWADRIVARFAEGERPFVAVGAAHMAGDEGLPALLAARGYTVRRVQ